METNELRRIVTGIGWVLMTLMSAVAGASHASGQCPELFKQVPSDGENWDNAGRAVALDGNLAVIGAHLDDDAAGDGGAVYVYRFNGTTWTEEDKLISGTPDVNDWFGYALAVREDAVLGDVVVVGTANDDDNGTDAGAAYVFQRSGGSWGLEKKLTASDGATGDLFGYDVAIDGNALVVGAVSDNHTGTDNGSAYVYRRHPVLGWLEEDKLTASDTADFDHFGSRVAIDDPVIVVAAASDDPFIQDSGSAYVFRSSGGSWTEEQKLIPLDGEAFDYFGGDVAVDGDVAVISAAVEDEAGIDAGAVYVFRHGGTTWTEEQKLMAPDGAAFDNFGVSVDVEGGVILVGAPLTDQGGTDSGALYTFASKGNAWAFDQKLAPSDVAAFDYAGYSVAISGNRALLGSPLDDDKGIDSGTATVFSVGEFVLAIEPAAVNPGDPISMDAFCGTPGSPVILVTTDFNGVPYFYMFLYISFAANHQLSLSLPAPGGLSGSDIGFLAFKFDAFGKVTPSNPDRLQFN